MCRVVVNDAFPIRLSRGYASGAAALISTQTLCKVIVKKKTTASPSPDLADALNCLNQQASVYIIMYSPHPPPPRLNILEATVT